MKKILKNNKMNNIRYLPARIAIAVFTCLILVAIMQWDNGLFKAEFREGDIALRDIFAPYDFNVRGDINTKATDKIKNEAVTSLPPVYIFDSELKASVLNKVKSVRGAIQVIKDASGMPDEKTLKVAEMSATYNISESLVKGILGSSDSAAFFKSAQDAVEEFMSKPIISTIAYLKLKDSGVTDITLLDKFTLSENGRKTKDLVTLEDAKNRKPEPFSSNIKDRKERLLFVDFVNAILAANVNYDEEITRARKEALIQNIQPVYNKIEVKKNEILLNKGERIGKLHVEKLKALEQGESFAAKISGLFGVAIVVGLFMLFLVLYMKIFDPVLMSGVKDLALLSVICILIISTAKIIVNSPWPSSMVPVAVAPMLIALLINSRLAIVFAFFLSVLIGMISGNILDVTGVCLAGSIVGIFAMKGVRRRSQLIMAGLAVGFANMSYLIGMGLVRGLDFHAFISEALFGLLNGAMSAVIVTGVLPIFENVFKISTDISLLELADLNHPLLKRMVMEAPGTYHHSLVVGNLAEAACESIGANALLARVGSYFHDIGKLEKASYFSENQSVKKSAHDKLSP
ncbi:MAG: HDIG domain-containing protein, partial [Candidatus Omnitrophica bacterium]|nr:HDIG domain-containing protein [Candidatus Omnitrophota bacterium]